MKSLSLITTMLILGCVLLLHTETSAAYTIGVYCQVNPVPPPSRPYQNVDCSYSWQVGGSALVIRGDWTADLIFRGNIMQPALVLLDEINRSMFAFADATSPESVYIGCTNQEQEHRIDMIGRSYKFVFGGTWGPGYWEPVQILIDSATAYVYAPLVTCS